MPDDIPKQVSRTVYLPPSREEIIRRREKNDRLRLQGEQSDEELARGHNGRYLPTQDWTPFHNDLMARAAAEGRALGHGASEDVISRMLNPGAAPADPNYRPSPEAIKLIAHTEAQEQVAQEEKDGTPLTLEEREARIARRESEIKEREKVAVREAELTAREAELDARERALEKRYDTPEQLDDLDSLRGFRPTTTGHTEFRPGAEPPPTWGGGGRKRMTPEERLAAEAEGVSLFGDGSESSAWSRLDHLDDTPVHRPRVSNDPAQRINDILASRQAQYSDDADGEAERLADLAAAQDQVVQEDNAGREAMRKEQEAYDLRQKEAEATIAKFRAEYGGNF